MKAILIFLSIFIMPLPALCADPKIPAKYENLFGKIDNLRANFTQTTYKKLRNRTITRSGDAFFSKPSMFRWNFVDSQNGVEEYYFNGERLTHFQEKNKIVNHYNTRAGLARELADVVNLVLDPNMLLNTYKVKETKTEGASLQVLLEPISRENTEIASIYVQVSDQKRFVEEVQIYYTDGNNTKFAFTNPQYLVNEPTIFTFSRQGNFTIRHHG